MHRALQASRACSPPVAFRGAVTAFHPPLLFAMYAFQPLRCQLGLLWYFGNRPSTAMNVENISFTARSNPSQRVIAIGIVFGFLYWASSVVIAILLAVLLAYFLDPVVKVLDRIHVPRALGALLVLLASGTALAAVGYSVADRLESFAGVAPLQHHFEARSRDDEQQACIYREASCRNHPFRRRKSALARR